MRVTGNVGRLVKSDHWASVQDYECRLSGVISERRIIVLCMYPLAKGGATELLDVTRSHKVSGTIRKGAWEIIETPELKLAKGEIRELYQHLEQKLAERTQALRAANEVLRREITERRKVADELRKQKEVLQKIFDHIPVMINLAERNRLTLVNREWERTLGWTLEEIQQNNINVYAEFYPDPKDRQRVLEFISTSHGQWGDFKTRVRSGRVIDTSWSVIHLSDGTNIRFGRDITEHKRAEERLKDTSVQLRALSASIQSAREEERARMARLIHDELGSALTSLKWDLEGLDNTLSEPIEPSALLAARASIAGMMKLADTTIDTVRRLAWELRPSILDDLGLVEALEWQAQQFEARTGIVCQRNRFAEEVQFTSEQSTEVFRIFQEALTNILRHAHASNVDVTMTKEGREFVLTVSDNGRGITTVEKSGLGILGMQERARLVGGKLAIQGVDGAGTTITLRVPLGQVPGLPS
jgi:PAS domain S-box-containing protein